MFEFSAECFSTIKIPSDVCMKLNRREINIDEYCKCIKMGAVADRRKECEKS